MSLSHNFFSNFVLNFQFLPFPVVNIDLQHLSIKPSHSSLQDGWAQFTPVCNGPSSGGCSQREKNVRYTKREKSQREEKDRKLLSLGVAKGQGLSEVSAALYMNL